MKSISGIIYSITCIMALNTSCSKIDTEGDIYENNIESKQYKEIKTVRFQENTENPNSIAYKATIKESMITGEAVSGGLVMIYQIENGKSHVIPYESKKAGQRISLDYSISRETIHLMLSSERKIADPEIQISYLIIEPGKLNKMKEAGYDISKIFQLNYFDLKNLYKNFH